MRREARAWPVTPDVGLGSLCGRLGSLRARLRSTVGRGKFVTFGPGPLVASGKLVPATPVATVAVATVAVATVAVATKVPLTLRCRAAG